MDLILRTHGVGQKGGPISIGSSGVSFGGRSVRSDDVISISSSLKSSREMLYSTVNAKITIKTRSDSMILKFSGSDGMFQKKFDEVLQSFISIRTQIIEHIGPRLLIQMLQSISSGKTFQIGRFAINSKGITTQTALRGELRAGWDEEFELRPKTKENLLLKYLNAGISSRDKFDHWEIVYHNRSLGRMISLGEFSFDDDNGCMVPFLLSYIKENSGT